ncbi:MULTISPECIES: outer membrane beta-barrel protein [unclassified Sphingomonas]|jgi:opacity protein-like surface antigen|uniref:outer membrane protein n=2 Tax=Pseudomonadota TaxID=1224 RepID=UPI0010F93346|nr:MULTISPECIES: outer membrane beta-barrel protein [unclassified Sphingomonas]
MMPAFRHCAFAALAIAATGVTPAAAQDGQPTGIYGVARAGLSIDTDARLQGNNPTGTLQRDTDYRRGFNGELGIGYDAGPFRLEGTVGYTTAGVDKKKAATGGFTADGRTKALTIGAAGYFDLPVSERVVPYVGGGIGLSRVDSRLSRLSGSPATGSRYSGKDWGFNWHLDAGLGIAATQSTTIELGARYSRTSSLRFDGFNGASKAEFRPRLSGWSALVGIRQAF